MADTITTFFCRGRVDGSPFAFTTQNKASAAAGTYCRSEIYDEAGDNSDYILTLPHDVIIYDVVSGAASGKIRVISDGVPTAVVIDFSMQQASSSGRPPLSIPLGGSKRYRFKVESALPA